jgi:hypothetical protein
MTAAVHPTLSTTVPGSATSSLWKPGLAAAGVAAVATTAIAEGARLLDVAVAVDGESIPIAGFAQMTLLFSIVGIAVASVLRRRAARPRHTFAMTTVVLTALSLLPDLMASTVAADKATLVLTHLAAAAIVIPAVTRRLPEARDAREL